MTAAFSHLGICVSDLEASLRFYCEGLGFEEVAAHEVGEEFAALMEVDGVRLRSRMVRRDGVTLELLDFVEPGTFGDADRRPMNQLGLTHLSFRVDDVARRGGARRGDGWHRGGGHPYDLRSRGAPPLDFVYCTDPDGVRIELMDLGG